MEATMNARAEPTGGTINAAISQAVVQIHNQYVGRGPTKARTIVHADVVVTVLEDTLTKAERSLVRNGKLNVVLGMRREFQQTMGQDLIAAVERLTGRRVKAFMSDNHVDPDLAAEMFVLGEPVSAQDDAKVDRGTD
jgi:uncharacterized protein YbcI